MSAEKPFVGYTDTPVLIDFLAVDLVCSEHRYMPLTTGERRHAVHRLSAQGLSGERVGNILRVTKRTVVRMLAQAPPPALDVDEEGNYIDSEGQYVGAVG